MSSWQSMHKCFTGGAGGAGSCLPGTYRDSLTCGTQQLFIVRLPPGVVPGGHHHAELRLPGRLLLAGPGHVGGAAWRRLQSSLVLTSMGGAIFHWSARQQGHARSDECAGQIRCFLWWSSRINIPPVPNTSELLNGRCSLGSHPRIPARRCRGPFASSAPSAGLPSPMISVRADSMMTLVLARHRSPPFSSISPALPAVPQ